MMRRAVALVGAVSARDGPDINLVSDENKRQCLGYTTNPPDRGLRVSAP